MRQLAVAMVLLITAGGLSAPVRAEDAHIRAAGPVGLGYVGMYYGLTDPAGTWYVGRDWLFGLPTQVWMAVADTGGSASVLGVSTQQAYYQHDGVGLPMQPYPDVKFTDEGFGGMVDFAVTEPLRIMIGDFKTVDTAADPEDPSLYSVYGPVGSPPPHTTHMAAALEPIGGGDIDFDIIGMSAMQGQVLHVDPHYLQFLRLTLIVMAGSLERPPPPPSHPRALYVPVTMQGFFPEPPPVDVGDHPMLPISIRREASDPFETRTALFDTGSPAHFVSESFATAAGIDINSPPELTITVSGLGEGQSERPGWYVDGLALDLGNGREGDQVIFADTGVFTIPDESMPGGLDAILGNSLFSPSMYFQDTSLMEWYVDTRDPENAHIILIPAKPGDADLDDVVDGGDYTLWADNYQTAGSWFEGDFNHDGVVDGGDFTLWADNFEAGGAAVPEPAGLAFLVVLAAMIRRRRP